MTNKQTNTNGFTLFEVLVAIVLFTFISFIAFEIIYSSFNQKKEQTEETVQINDAAFFLKQITKDIRKSNEVTTSVNSNETIYVFKGSNSNITYNYLKNENQINRNNSMLVNQLKNFELSIVDHTISLSFTLNGKAFSTKIILRKGQSS